MTFLKTLILSLLNTYKLPAVFAGTLLFGDAIVILAFILAFQLGWNITLVFLVAGFATLFGDSLWYIFGEKIPGLLEKRWPRMFKRYENWFELVDESVPFNRPLSMLLYFKFLQGTRIFIVIYLSIRKVKYWRFILMDLVGTLIWVTSLLGFAYLSFTGTSKLFQQFEILGPVFTAMFLSFISIRIISKIVSRKFDTKRKSN